jgi:hypothetical protein
LLEQPIEVPENSTITIRLVQETLAQHNIGRFRLASTSLPKGAVAIGGVQIPESIKSIVQLAKSDRTAEQRKELEAYYRKVADGPIQQAIRDLETAKK